MFDSFGSGSLTTKARENVTFTEGFRKSMKPPTGSEGKEYTRNGQVLSAAAVDIPATNVPRNPLREIMDRTSE